MCAEPNRLRALRRLQFVLGKAIAHDTEFLAAKDVMDYSLLVGVDDKQELVVGIIDYIRTFTWCVFRITNVTALQFGASRTAAWFAPTALVALASSTTSDRFRGVPFG